MVEDRGPRSDDAASSDPTDASSSIAGYEELTEIGAGGFGVVFRARQPEFKRFVAIKVLTGLRDARARRRFDRERELVGSLSGHPNIVTVHASGFTADGSPYLVMEYLGRGSLADRLREGALPWPEAIEIGAKLCAAVQTAHSAGVLHRDIKPENVLISELGEPKLADFGIAVLQGGTETSAGFTPAHAPPEVLAGKAATPASDVYSLASTIYALIAGRPAFWRETDDSFLPVLARITSEPVPDLRPHGVPDQVCAVIENAMDKEPTERVAPAAEFGHRLSTVPAASDGGTTLKAPPQLPSMPLGSAPRPAPRRPRRSRRRWVLVGVVLAAALALAGGAVLAVGGGSTHEQQAARANPKIVQSIPAPFPTNGIDASPEGVWVTNARDNTVVRIDAATNRLLQAVPVGATPDALVLSRGVWIATFSDQTGAVSYIDPEVSLDRVAARIPVGKVLAAPFNHISIAAGMGGIWVTNTGDNTVSRIGTSTRTVVATIPVGRAPVDIAVGLGAVWVANGDDGTVSRIDPTSNSVTDVIPVGHGAGQVGAGEGAVWVADFNANLLIRLDPSSKRVTATIPVTMAPRRLNSIAIGEGAVWTANGATPPGSISRIDPKTNRVTAEVPLDGPAIAVAVGKGAVWVTGGDAQDVVRIDPSPAGRAQ